MVAPTTTVEVKKTRFMATGWRFDESFLGVVWQIVATKEARTIVSRAPDRRAAWDAVFERIEDKPNP